MKILLPILLFTFAAVSLHAAEPQSPRSPLPPAECIDTTQINEWHIVDAQTAIVRTGPRHYLVRLQSACPQLNQPPGLIFHANASNTSINQGRICGEPGETVRSHNQPPCSIQSVSEIDKARFEQLSSQAGRQAGATAQQTIQPSH